jgi:hypothetical protein
MEQVAMSATKAVTATPERRVHRLAMSGGPLSVCAGLGVPLQDSP